MTKKEFLELARNVSWIGVDFILRYNNPKWLGMADVHKGMHQVIDECKKQIEEAKQGIRSWEDVKSTVLFHVPRGHGKSSQILGRILWELGRNPNHKIKIVCETDDNARKRVIFLQQQILHNKHLHLLFPHLKPADSGLWNNLQLYVKRDIISVDPSIEGCGILSSSTGGRATILFCLDSKSKILTKRGWVFGTELRSDDEIAVYNPHNKSIYFTPPLKIHVFKARRSYVRIHHPSFGVKVATKDHKVLFRYNGRLMVSVAKNLLHLHRKNFALPVAGYKADKTVDDKVLLSCKEGAISFNILDLCWLLGRFLRTGFNQRFYLPPTATYHNQYLLSILYKYNIHYEIRGNFLYIHNDTLRHYFNLIAKGQPLHTVLPFLFELSYQEYAQIFEGFDIDGKIGNNYKISLTSRDLDTSHGMLYIIEALSLIAPLCGMRIRYLRSPRVKPKIEISSGEEIEAPYSVISKEKEDLWWCVTTPTGYFVAQRNGHIFITGNCDDPIGMKNALIYPENAKKAEESFYSNWLPMLEDDGFTVIAYTVWTENDFPFKMEKECNKCITYVRLVDDDLNPVWPEKFPKEKLLEIKEKIGPTAFARGYQGKPGSPKDKLFDKEAVLAAINPNRKLGSKPDPNTYTFIGVDLAISKKKTGKRTAIVVIQVDNQGKRTVLDVVAEKMTSIETAYKIINLAKRYNPVAIYVENNAYQEALIEWVDVVDTQGVITGLVQGYYTGAQKFDPLRGLPALAGEIQKGLWEFATTDHDYNDTCNCPFCIMITEFLTFPFGKTSDIVMATFFAREAYKNLVGEAADLDIKFLILGEE